MLGWLHERQGPRQAFAQQTPSTQKLDAAARPVGAAVTDGAVARGRAAQSARVHGAAVAGRAAAATAAAATAAAAAGAAPAAGAGVAAASAAAPAAAVGRARAATLTGVGHRRAVVDHCVRDAVAVAVGGDLATSSRAKPTPRRRRNRERPIGDTRRDGDPAGARSWWRWCPPARSPTR